MLVSYLRQFTISLSIAVTLVPSVVMAVVPNDPLFFQSQGVEAIQLPQAWDITQGSPAVVVAVIDAGVDITNPDLAPNIWVNSEEIVDGIDNDGNGLIDDINGWNFVQNNNNVRPNSLIPDASKIGLNHGTVVSGIIGAVGNNAMGGAGVNWRVRIMPLKILDERGDGDTDMAVRAIDYAIQKKASIINLSFVGPTPSLDFIQAVRRAYRAGILVVAAAGNAGEGGVGINLQHSPQYPVCFDDPLKEENWVIGVAALGPDGQLTKFSNYGERCIDISAPGAQIPSTILFDSMKPFDVYGGSWSGTSVAAPFVSGVAALVKSVQPTWGPDQIRKALLETVDLIPGNTTRDAGRGSVNALKALRYALQGGDGGLPVGFFVATTKVGQTVYADFFDTSLNRLKTVNVGKGVFGSSALTTADIDGTGVGQIITAIPDSKGTIIRVMQRDGKVIREFRPFGSREKREVTLSSADVTNDGADELVITSQALRQVVVASGTGKILTTIRVPDKTGTISAIGAREPDRSVIMTTVQQGKTVRVYVWDPIGSFISQFDTVMPTNVLVRAEPLRLQNGVYLLELLQKTGNRIFVRTIDQMGEVRSEYTTQPTTGTLLGFTLGKLAQSNSDRTHLVMAVKQGSTLVFEAVDSEGTIVLRQKSTVRPQYYNLFFGK